MLASVADAVATANVVDIENQTTAITGTYDVISGSYVVSSSCRDGSLPTAYRLPQSTSYTSYIQSVVQPDFKGNGEKKF